MIDLSRNLRISIDNTLTPRGSVVILVRLDNTFVWQ